MSPNIEPLDKHWKGKAWGDGERVTRVPQADGTIAEATASLAYGWNATSGQYQQLTIDPATGGLVVAGVGATGGGAVASVFGRTGAVAAQAGDFYGVQPFALTGATQTSRYVGATASGAPTSGTFAVGDFVVDQTGSIWICTTAGTPGVWVQTAAAATQASWGGTNVKAFGAVGNGVTDDTVAFQNAINAASGSVYVPPATYVITSLQMKSNMTITGDRGSTLLRKSGATGVMLVASSAVNAVRIVGLNFDSGGSAFPQEMIQFANGSSDVLIEKCRFTNTSNSYAIDFLTGTATNRNIRIRDNFMQCDGTAANFSSILVYNPYNVWVEDNLLQTAGAVGLHQANASVTVCRGLYVLNNRFQQCGETNIMMRPGTAATMEDIVVDGNTCEDAGSTTYNKGLIAVGENNGSVQASCRRVRISNNTLKCFYGNAIVVGGGNYGATSVCEDVAIVGNTVNGSTTASPMVYTQDENTAGPAFAYNIGISVKGTYNFTIADNQVHWTGRSGLRLLGAHRGTISGNVISHCMQGTGLSAPTEAQEASAIYLSDDSFTFCDNLTFVGNVIRNTGLAGNIANTPIMAGIGARTTSGLAVENDIQIVDNRFIEDRGGSGCQAYCVRIGDNLYPGDGNQPQRWMVRNNVFTGGYVTAPMIRWNTTDKGHIIGNNMGVNEVFRRDRKELVNVTVGGPFGANPATLTETFDFTDMNIATPGSALRVLVSGTLYGGAIGLLAGDTLTGMSCYQSAAASPVMTLAKMAAYTPTGTQLAWVDVTGAPWASTGVKVGTFGTPYTSPSDQVVYLCILTVLSSGTVTLLTRQPPNSNWGVGTVKRSAIQTGLSDLPTPAVWAADGTVLYFGASGTAFSV